MFTKCSFDEKENKLDYCRRKDCIKKLCKKLKKRAMEIINYEKKEMTPLTYEENKSYKKQEACYICEEKLCMDKDDENYKKNASYYTHFIINQLAEELKGELNSIGENMEKIYHFFCTNEERM